MKVKIALHTKTHQEFAIYLAMTFACEHIPVHFKVISISFCAVGLQIGCALLEF